VAKDPAVLFYTNDFLAGTFTMDDEQVGKYIRLLCIQHQKGRLTEKDMLNICKTYDEEVFAKFTKDDNHYYNKRMEEESIKRKKYTESRRNNRKGNNKKNMSKTYVKHMEDVNENENENKDKKHKHGEYKNVLLTEDEYTKLKGKFGSRLEHWVNELSEGLKLHGYKYKSHYLAILKWARKAGEGVNQPEKELDDTYKLIRENL